MVRHSQSAPIQRHTPSHSQFQPGAFEQTAKTLRSHPLDLNSSTSFPRPSSALPPPPPFISDWCCSSAVCQASCHTNTSFNPVFLIQPKPGAHAAVRVTEKPTSCSVQHLKPQNTLHFYKVIYISQTLFPVQARASHLRNGRLEKCVQLAFNSAYPLRHWEGVQDIPMGAI